MTPEQQRRCVGISAEADGDLIIIHADRSFAGYTPREIEVFCGHLRLAYGDAMRECREQAIKKGATGALV